MIVVSAGLPKAGSALFFNLTNDLLVAAGKEDIRNLKREFGLSDMLRHHNCNIGSMTPKKLGRLLGLHRRGKTFVVKTHEKPPAYFGLLKTFRVAKVTCIVRDPRDVVVSAMEHGKKIMSSGENHTFAACDTLESTVSIVKSWLVKDMIPWIEHIPHFLTRFEELTKDPFTEMAKLAGFLDLEQDEIDFGRIIERYYPENISEELKGILHFNKGVVGRYLDVLTSKEIDFCHRQLTPYLEKFGYTA